MQRHAFFAGEGARVFVAGRTRDKLERVVRDIVAAGGVAEAAVLDALDESAVERHAAEVAEKAGGIDVELNAVGLPHVQGTPFVELSLADFLQPITENSRTNFITAKAVSRHMLKRKKGVILTLCPPGGRLVGEGTSVTARVALPSRLSRACSLTSSGRAEFVCSA